MRVLAAGLLHHVSKNSPKIARCRMSLTGSGGINCHASDCTANGRLSDGRVTPVQRWQIPQRSILASLADGHGLGSADARGLLLGAPPAPRSLPLAHHTQSLKIPRELPRTSVARIADI